jgi:hypothetical protein
MRRCQMRSHSLSGIAWPYKFNLLSSRPLPTQFLYRLCLTNCALLHLSSTPYPQTLYHGQLQRLANLDRPCESGGRPAANYYPRIDSIVGRIRITLVYDDAQYRPSLVRRPGESGLVGTCRRGLSKPNFRYEPTKILICNLTLGWTSGWEEMTDQPITST